MEPAITRFSRSQRESEQNLSTSERKNGW